MKTREQRERYAATVRGCLLGGAIGDALGAPVEFLRLAEIHDLAGSGGVRAYLPYDREHSYGVITDDTQMTLFTVEGLIQAGIRRDRGLGLTVAVLHQAYDNWLSTQLLPAPSSKSHGFLSLQGWLYARRAPGRTCIDALQANRTSDEGSQQYGRQAVNDSKGCGTVMRSAPFGLLPTDLFTRSQVFAMAAEAAGYTHGHVTAHLASGTFPTLVAGLVVGDDIDQALGAALEILVQHPGHEETLAALNRVQSCDLTRPSADQLEALGEGWVAEEALAIALYAALAYAGPDQVLDALSLAVTHSGDSDSTGSICGNLLGALHGDTSLPPELAFDFEGRGTILQLADDFVWEFTEPERLHGDYGPHTRWTQRY